MILILHEMAKQKSVSLVGENFEYHYKINKCKVRYASTYVGVNVILKIKNTLFIIKLLMKLFR